MTSHQWRFHNPVRLRFGDGRLNDLTELANGKRVLVVTTPGFIRRGLVERLREMLKDAVVHVVADVQPNPELNDLESQSADAVNHQADLIIAVGGGSVMDSGKTLGVLLVKHGEGFSLREHLEGGGGAIEGAGVPVVAVPTTAGTGSEVTPFATVWDSTTMRKYSLSGPMLFPHTALLDPTLTLTLHESITVHSGLDAISQAFEALWNKRATPITTAYATQALRIALPALRPLVRDLSNLDLRIAMQTASLLAGLAISHTRTALAHSISYPLTLHLGVPHGLACSFTLPTLLGFNAEMNGGAFEDLAASLRYESLHDLRSELAQLLREVGVPAMLEAYGADVHRLVDYIPEMRTPERAGNTLREASDADLERILIESVTGFEL